MNKHPFDLAWQYAEAYGEMALAFAQWQPVNLPHDAMIARPRAASNPSGSQGGYFPGSVITYRQTLHRNPWKHRAQGTRGCIHDSGDSVGSPGERGDPMTIDRRVLVRHHITLTQPDALSPLSVGNGEFAFTTDITGLQTFPG